MSTAANASILSFVTATGTARGLRQPDTASSGAGSADNGASAGNEPPKKQPKVAAVPAKSRASAATPTYGCAVCFKNSAVDAEETCSGCDFKQPSLAVAKQCASRPAVLTAPVVKALLPVIRKEGTLNICICRLCGKQLEFQ